MITTLDFNLDGIGISDTFAQEVVLEAFRETLEAGVEDTKITIRDEWSFDEHCVSKRTFGFRILKIAILVDGAEEAIVALIARGKSYFITKIYDQFLNGKYKLNNSEQVFHIAHELLESNIKATRKILVLVGVDTTDARGTLFLASEKIDLSDRLFLE